ncbi:MAG: hypothetical protein IPN29_13920 [Saprospiraceae bacterium]|nr:hypothetical protein [Saprospiraceae bacterium]
MFNKSIINDPFFVILIALTLGLAPFVPEPHIWGKLKWVAGGAEGMKAMDYFDLAMHGLPWLLVIRLAFVKIKEMLSKANSPS